MRLGPSIKPVRWAWLPSKMPGANCVVASCPQCGQLSTLYPSATRVAHPTDSSPPDTYRSSDNYAAIPLHYRRCRRGADGACHFFTRDRDEFFTRRTRLRRPAFGLGRFVKHALRKLQTVVMFLRFVGKFSFVQRFAAESCCRLRCQQVRQFSFQ